GEGYPTLFSALPEPFHRDSVPLTLSGRLCLEPFTEDKDQSIVCLIRFAKIKDFRGEVQITNAFDATRLYLNPMIPELTDLTERLSDDHLSVALVDKHDGKKDGKRIKYDWNDAEIKSTAEVNEANQVEICKIIFCRSNITNVSLKFNLHLVVKDDTWTCNLMLLGSVGQSIVGVKAEELWDGSYEEVLFCSNCVLMLDQNSSEDFPTPITKRKEDHSDLTDISSSSKKLCTKMIKQEKEKKE
ncbi:unnamed protein product, partial [Brassica rapa]